MAVQTSAAPAPARAAFYNDPKIRGLFYQVVLLALVTTPPVRITPNAVEVVAVRSSVPPVITRLAAKY